MKQPKHKNKPKPQDQDFVFTTSAYPNMTSEHALPYACKLNHNGKFKLDFHEHERKFPVGESGVLYNEDRPVYNAGQTNNDDIIAIQPSPKHGICSFIPLVWLSHGWFAAFNLIQETWSDDADPKTLLTTIGNYINVDNLLKQPTEHIVETTQARDKINEVLAEAAKGELPLLEKMMNIYEDLPIHYVKDNIFTSHLNIVISQGKEKQSGKKAPAHLSIIIGVGKAPTKCELINDSGYQSFGLTKKKVLDFIYYPGPQCLINEPTMLLLPCAMKDVQGVSKQVNAQYSYMQYIPLEKAKQIEFAAIEAYYLAKDKHEKKESAQNTKKQIKEAPVLFQLGKDEYFKEQNQQTQNKPKSTGGKEEDKHSVQWDEETETALLQTEYDSFEQQQILKLIELRNSQTEQKQVKIKDKKAQTPIKAKEKSSANEQITIPNLEVDYNHELVRMYCRYAETNKKLLDAANPMIKYLNSINVRHENYESLTRQPIVTRLRIINALTKRRNQYKDSFEIKHYIPVINDWMWRGIEKLFNFSPQDRALVEEIFKSGDMPLSPLQNAKHFRFDLKPYDHPFERLVNDILTMDVLSTIPNGARIMDIGSKFNKLIDYMPHKQFSLVAVRPALLNTDTDYLEKNLPKEDYDKLQEKSAVSTKSKAIEVEVLSIKLTKNTSMYHIMDLLENKNRITHITAIDAHYYAGVQEFLNNINRNTQVLCVSNAYAQLNKPYIHEQIIDLDSNSGTYKVFKHEGKQYVESHMDGNYTVYTHPNLPIDGEQPKSVACLNKMCFLQDAIRLGQGVHTVSYKLTNELTEHNPELHKNDAKIQEALYKYSTMNARVLQSDERRCRTQQATAYITKELSKACQLTYGYILSRVVQLWPTVTQQVLEADERMETKFLMQKCADKYEDPRFLKIDGVRKLPLTGLSRKLKITKTNVVYACLFGATTIMSAYYAHTQKRLWQWSLGMLVNIPVMYTQILPESIKALIMYGTTTAVVRSCKQFVVWAMANYFTHYSVQKLTQPVLSEEEHQLLNYCKKNTNNESIISKIENMQTEAKEASATFTIFKEPKKEFAWTKLGGKYGYKVLDLTETKLFKKYDPKRKKDRPNGNLENMECFTLTGRKITLDQLREELKQIDRIEKRDPPEIFNPGLPMDSQDINLHYAKIDNTMLLDTLISRNLGNVNQPHPKAKKEYIAFINKEMKSLKLKVEQTALITEPLSTQEYINQLKNNRQRTRYTAIAKRMETDNHIEHTLTAELKKYEQQFTEDVRGRIILSPPDTLVLVLGVVNHYYLRVLKQIHPQFVSGLDLEQLADLFQEAQNGIKEPVNVSTDVSQYDASQHDWLFQHIDIPLLKIIIPITCQKLQWDAQLMENLMRVICTTKFKIQVFYMGTRRPMITGVTVGMTLSGVATQTTAGNTQREIIKSKFIQEKLKLKDEEYTSLHAGDDTVTMITKNKVHSLISEWSKYFAPDQNPEPHGIGAQIKTLTISDTYVDFLSKDIFILPGQTLVARKPERVFQGGQITTKLSKELTPALFNYGITQQLKAGHTFHPIYSSYIKYREKNLAHLYTSKQVIQDYKALHNLNNNYAYDTQQVSELYDQFIPWLGSSELDFEWTPFYRQEVIPNLKYDINEGYPNRFNREPVKIGGHYCKNIKTNNNDNNTKIIINKYEEMDENKKERPQRSRGKVWKSGLSQSELERKVKEAMALARSDDALKKIEDKIMDIERRAASFVGDKTPEMLVREYTGNKEQRALLQPYMNAIREATNPFHNIPTQEIKQFYPNFTYSKRQQAQSTGFDALNTIDAFKAQGVIKGGDVIKPEEFQDEPKEESYDQYIQTMNDLYKKYHESTKITKAQIRELIALDDWKSFLWKTVPKIIKFGAPFVQQLYKAYVKPTVHTVADQLGVKEPVEKIEEIFGGDEGYNPVDQGNYALEPYKLAKQEGINYFDQETQHQLRTQSSGEVVDVASVATFICPENYVYKTYFQNPRKVDIASDTSEIAITTNGNGAVGLRHIPGGVTLVDIANASTFAPVNGTNGTTWSGAGSRILRNEQSVESLRVSATAITVQLATNQNENGTVQMCYLRELVNPSTSALDPYAIARGEMGQQPFYQTGNSYNQYRMILPFSEQTETFYNNSTGSTGTTEQPQVYILLTGFPPNQTIGHVNVTQVAEFTPFKGSNVIHKVKYGTNTPKTREYLEGILINYPQLQNLVHKDAQYIAGRLMKHKFLTAQQIDQVIEQCLERITQIATHGGKITVGGDPDRDFVVKSQLEENRKLANDVQVVSTIYDNGQVYLIGENPCKAYAYAYEFAQLPKQKSLAKFQLIALDHLKHLDEKDLCWPRHDDLERWKQLYKNLRDKQLKADPFEANIIHAVANQLAQYAQTGYLGKQFDAKQNSDMIGD